MVKSQSACAKHKEKYGHWKLYFIQVSQTCHSFGIYVITRNYEKLKKMISHFSQKNTDQNTNNQSRKYKTICYLTPSLRNSSFTSWLKNPQECKRHALPLLPPHPFPPDSSLAPPPPLPPPPALPPTPNPSQRHRESLWSSMTASALWSKS